MPTKTLHYYIEQAFERYYAGELDQAEAMLRQALEMDPAAPEPIIHLANLLRMRHRIDQAVEILKPIATPDAPIEYRWLLFEAYWVAGDFSTAHPLAIAILEQMPPGDERMKNLLEYARQSGDWDLALRTAQRLNDSRIFEELQWIRRFYLFFKILPRRLRNLFIHSLVDRFWAQNRWRVLRILLEAACRSDSTCADWPLRLGQLVRKNRDVYDPDWEKEKIWYEQALHIDSFRTAARMGLLSTLFDMERWMDVLDQLPQESNAEPPELRFRLKAACLANLGRIDEADELYRSLEAGASFPYARFNRALIALEREVYPSAISFLSEPAPPNGLRIFYDFFRAAVKTLLRESSKSVDGQKILDALWPSLPFPRENSNKPLKIGEPTRCRLCGNLTVKEPLWRETVTGWMRARCPKCSFISVDPMPSPEEIRNFYTHPQRSNLTIVRLYRKAVLEMGGATEAACRQHPLFHDITQWNLQWDWQAYEEKIDSEKRCLDIGCSAGRVLDLFQRIGWQAEGIDVDAEAVNFARAHGLHAVVGALETWNRPDSYYHLITMVDVIEHVEDPIRIVQKCFDLLQPGGLFFIKTPCADSLPHGFLGHCWLDFSEHLSFFSRHTLEQLLTHAGFHIVGIKQILEPTIPFVFYDKWQQQMFPQLLNRWINRLNVGDTILLLGQKSEVINT